MTLIRAVEKCNKKNTEKCIKDSHIVLFPSRFARHTVLRKCRYRVSVWRPGHGGERTVYCHPSAWHGLRTSNPAAQSVPDLHVFCFFFCLDLGRLEILELPRRQHGGPALLEAYLTLYPTVMQIYSFVWTSSLSTMYDCSATYYFNVMSCVWLLWECTGKSCMLLPFTLTNAVTACNFSHSLHFRQSM